jgi:hypothetical protein
MLAGSEFPSVMMGLQLAARETCLMHFTDEEVDLACQMREQGLPWEPAVGHYVFDETGLIEVPSPFQKGVYFILDMKHFLRRAGSVEALKARMFWLPQWHQARRIARELGVLDTALVERLADGRAFASDAELSTLYRMILEALRNRAEGDSAHGAGDDVS